MENQNLKAIEFIYMETEIHFLVNPNDRNVMVNATEMAKAFQKRVSNFMSNDNTKRFMLELEEHDKRTGIPVRLIDNRGRNGIYFDRRLALKFAAWLNPKFEVWVFSTIDEILFGHYKEHWEAHAAQEEAKLNMMNLKNELLVNPTPEKVAAYFEQERVFNSSKSKKMKAIRSQLKLFNQ